jgi:hypothetical protein
MYGSQFPGIVAYAALAVAITPWEILVPQNNSVVVEGSMKQGKELRIQP